MSGRETDLIRWLRRAARGAGGELIGDDAALLTLGGDWAVTVDQQIEGTHFLPGLDPAVGARRLVAVNLSDLAAVGALPKLALATLAAPAGFDHRRFLAALLAECRRWGIALIGGDVAAAPSFAATLTLCGRRRPRGRWLLRSNAQPGDALWCGTPLGESALGAQLLLRGAGYEAGKVQLPPALARDRALARVARRAVRRHLLPRPQLSLSAWLAAQRRAAAIDISDGLGLDLSRLAEESGVGAVVEADALPRAPGFAALAARLGLDREELVLGGGEDYVLLFAIPAEVVPPSTLKCRRIGTITRQQTLLIQRGGNLAELPRRGFDHLASE